MSARPISARSPISTRAPIAALSLLAALASIALPALAPAAARALPDNRTYELVTRNAPEGRELGLNGVEPTIGFPSVDGEAVDWEGLGACCDANSGVTNLFQSDRHPDGWQTRGLLPAPLEPETGFATPASPVFWTSDLQHTIYSTTSAYDPRDTRAKGGSGEDLYLQEPDGALEWLTQGPLSTGGESAVPTYEGATPNASEVVFASAEALTADATGLTSESGPYRYLYARNVPAGTTSLVDVNDEGALISPYGATLGRANGSGTTTHAISQDGTKVFFETPPDGLPEPAHLYMRDLANDTTTSIDDPQASGSARYEGASVDGSLVFFTSDEGLDGASSANELYVFNTTAGQIGQVPPMSSVPLGGGAGIVGVSAIADEGSRVYFVADGVLAGNSNSTGATAVAGRPNLYLHDLDSGDTTFVATLAATDVISCDPTCAAGAPAGLVAARDIDRAAFPTPNAATLVFDSSGDLTGEDRMPATSLTAEAPAGAHTLVVASTAGFEPAHLVAIGSGASEELYEVQAVDSPTELTLIEYSPHFNYGLGAEHAAGAPVTQLNVQLYRYAEAGSSLTCISCVGGAGVVREGSSTAVAGSAGSYGVPGLPLTMNEAGTEVFFQASEPLNAEATNSSGVAITGAYEWEGGKVSLISSSFASAFLDGTDTTGDDVFISTREQLTGGTGERFSEGFFSIYDARVNGGFPAPAAPVSCEGADCRGPSGAAAFFSVPASATLINVREAPPPSAARNSFTVSSLSAAQRARLARTGAVQLTVDTTGAGRITVSTLARIGGKLQSVAHAAASLAQGGTTKLTLRLSRAALRALRRHGSLALRMQVSFSASTVAKVLELDVKAPHVKRLALGGRTR